MSLIDLISPKWKHSNPEVRVDAVKHMTSDDLDLLKKIAGNDREPKVRKVAAEKISDIDALKTIAENDTDKEVRETARKNLNRIYYNLILDASDSDTRKTYLKHVTGEELIRDLACRMDDPDFRLAAVERISSEELLCTIAESNCGAIAGDAIVDKISNPDALHRISEKASNKKTRKKALDKLDAIVEKENTPSVEKEKKSSLEDILNSLEIRLTPANWEKGALILKEAEASWETLDPHYEHPLFDGFSNARQALKKQIAIYEKRDQTIEAFEGLVKDIEDLMNSHSSDTLNQVENIKQKWHAIDKNSIPFITFQELEKRFTLAVESVTDAHHKMLEEAAKRQENLKKMVVLLEKAETLLTADDWENTDKKLADITQAWQTVVYDSSDTSSIKARFEVVVNDVREKHRKVLEEREHEQKKQEEKLRTLLENVEKALCEQDNTLFKFASIVKTAKNEWKDEGKQVPEIKQQLNPKFQEACDTFFNRLNEYKSNREWELWANLTQKTELCEVVESISDSLETDKVLEGAANIVKEVQAKWKMIGPVARDKSDEIWDRFRKACDKVYAHCYEQKKVLHDALAEAVQISNYNQATEKIKEIQKAWNSIGMLPLSMEKELRASYQNTCDSFFEQRREFFRKRDDERNENLKIKKALCEEAETLSESTDWNTTAEELKQLQQKWKETGPAPKQEGDVLWERFQTACNMFFERLEQVKPDNLKKKEEICEQVEEIVSSLTHDGDIEPASRKVMALQQEWKEIGPVPKENIEPIWQRFHTACEVVFDKRREYYVKRKEAWSENETLKEKLVIKAEELSDSTDWENTPQKLKDLQAEWKNIAPASRKTEQELWDRLNTACDTFFTRRREFFQKQEQEREENLKKKEDLCLTMELLAKLLLEDSILDYNKHTPIAEQLSKAMELRDEVVVPGEEAVTRGNIIRKIKEIQAEWKDIGPVPNNYDRQLWERFQKANDHLYSSKMGLRRE